MTRSAKVFISSVIGVGAAAIVASAPSGVRWASAHLGLFLALAAGILVAERFVIHLTMRDETMSFSVVEIAMTIALLTMPLKAFVLAVAAGLMVAQVIRRRPLVKAAFNTGMYALAAAGAGVLFHLSSASHAMSRPEDWLFAVAAMAVFFSLNQSLLAGVIASVEERPFIEILSQGLPIMASVWAGNTALGILGYLLAQTNPASALLLVVPSALSYAAYRAWVRSKAESRKMQQLYEVGSALNAGLSSEEVLGGFLTKAREMFRADGAQILIFDGPSQLRVIDPSGAVTERTDDLVGADRFDPNIALESYLAGTEWESHIMARLSTETGLTGALIVHDHRGAEGPAAFPKQDQDLLRTLSNQLSVRLRNMALFDSISEERAKLSDIVEHTSDGIYQVSNDRRIITWNPAMETITGFSAAEAVGQMCFNILRARDSRGIDMCSKDCPILAAGLHKCHHDAEAQIMTKDGAAKWIAYSHSPILDHNSVMTSDVIVVRDVTKQKAAQELKDDFVSTVSHELRTPITPIKGFLMTLMRPTFDPPLEERRNFYGMMLKQTERLERLVNDLLDASRLESGKIDVDTHPLDVAGLTDATVDSYRISHPDRAFRFSSNKPAAYAIANPGRLEQVVCNLINNAIRYAPDTEPIDVIVRAEANEVTISVRDRGPGISFEEQELVFERFYRSGHHLTREQGGTGLGLYISKRLMEAMGGSLSLVSRLGSGSTFALTLGTPVRQSQPKRAENPGEFH